MKFKNTKKKSKRNKSPSNSRSIPAFDKTLARKPDTFLKMYTLSLKIFVVLIFLLTTVIVGIDLQKNITLKDNIDRQRGDVTRELKFWESFIGKHQDYRDAYFKMSVLEYKLGNISSAKEYVSKGLSLDPNSENGKKLEQFLVNK
ncbi:MAG: tetratricopeptide repeat protein [Candidatus Levybacteria bacterium]|nr:tetratricopeptide repeat protein [Candidatus Levybacteria bacterium]